MKRADIDKVLIIGSGPIVIGQACEFDYSGTQACKALRACGYKVVLVNSNPATIMTDTTIADKVYMEPLTLEYIAKIVRKERPDAILPGIGGQTGLNLAIQLEKKGIPTHFVQELSERETLVKKVSIVPLEVIIRNISAGSFSKRYGVEEGIVFDAPTIEFSYKNDDLGDPLLNEYHALALKLATKEEIETIKKYAFAVNDELKAFWKTCGVTLVDFKLEFGRLSDGTIVLADEISPDTCRLWDSKTNEKLDKDRFRRDMGGVEEAYQEIMRRLTEA